MAALRPGVEAAAAGEAEVTPPSFAQPAATAARSAIVRRTAANAPCFSLTGILRLSAGNGRRSQS